jgi:hypothetical protein
MRCGNVTSHAQRYYHLQSPFSLPRTLITLSHWTESTLNQLRHAILGSLSPYSNGRRLKWSSTTKPLNWLVFPIPENQGKGNQTHKRKEKLIKRKREEKNNDNWQLSAPDIGRHDLQTDIPGKCYVKSLEFFSLRMAAQTETPFDFILIWGTVFCNFVC